MPLNSEVVTGLLPTADSDTVDLVSSGFGTVSAALIITTVANSSTNPQSGLSYGVAFWDGTNLYGMGSASADALATSDTDRYSDSNEVIHANSGNVFRYSVENITNGIRLTKNSGTTSVNRYVTVKLFAGLTNAKAFSFQTMGNGPGSVTGLDFPLTGVFAMSISASAENAAWSSANFGFGVAHKNSAGVIRQGCAESYANNGATTTNTGTVLQNSYLVGDPELTLDAVNDDGFDYTIGFNSGNDWVFGLAFQCPNDDDFHVEFDSANTSGTDNILTGFGFQPISVGSIFGVGATWGSGTGLTTGIGLADQSAMAAHWFHDQDNETGTSNSASQYASDKFINHTYDTGSTHSTATVRFLRDGINLVQGGSAPTAANRIIWALGDSSASSRPLDSRVVSGTLPQDPDGSYQDFTVEDFGPVDAALIIMSGANTSNNPATNLSFGIGFWDGETVSSISVFSDNGETTTNTARYSDPDSLNFEWMDFSISNIEDGIRITKESGSISVDRYVSVQLLTGLDAAKVGVINLGTGTSAIDVTDVGFKPNALMMGCIGISNLSYSGAHALMSFGIAHNNSSNAVTQRSVMFSAKDGETGASDTDRYMSDQHIAGQHYVGSLNWGASVSDFDSDGFSITPNTNAGNDAVFYLAIKTPNPDDFYLGSHTMPTSTGNQVLSDFGLSPKSVGMFTADRGTLNVSALSAIFSLGMGDSSTEAGYAVRDRNGEATSDSDSHYDSSNILKALFSSGTTNALANIASLDSDGMTLNFTDAALTENYYFVWAFGSANGERMVMPTVRNIFSNTVKPTVRT